MARRRRRSKKPRRIKSAIKWLLCLVLAAFVAVFGLAYLRDQPQNLPWTELKLDDPIGYFTGAKLAGLSDDYGRCKQLLDQQGVSYRPFPDTGADQCRRDDNISLLASGSGAIAYSPEKLTPSCPVVAAMNVWENQVVQVAAAEHLGQRVVRIQHLGSFSCRPIAGTDQWSEHATANAIDIAAFILEDGTTISLSGHWGSGDGKAHFLKQVRDGSCDLFSTVLSPDYNRAHADHFHLDQAARGAMGVSMCR